MKSILKAILIFLTQAILMCLIFQVFQIIYWLFNHNLPIIRDFENDWMVIVGFSAVMAYRMSNRNVVIANTERNLDMIYRSFQHAQLREIDVTGANKTYKVPQYGNLVALTVCFEETEQELRLNAPWYIIKGIQSAIEGYDIPPPVK